MNATPHSGVADAIRNVFEGRVGFDDARRRGARGASGRMYAFAVTTTGGGVGVVGGRIGSLPLQAASTSVVNPVIVRRRFD